MELQEGKVSVWVCQEEKLVSGLSHRTTCSDVVRAVLADSQRRGQPQPQPQPQPQSPGAMLRGPASAYCVVEKWRGAERRLPGRTRLLRLWAAWGAERDNVRFVLVRRGASLPGAGPRSAEARVVPSRDWDGDRDGPGPGSGARQRRAVRKAFRKLAAIQRRQQQQQQQQQLLGPQPQPQPEPAAQERMETLVHLVLSQDQTLRQQGQRLRELDRHIEGYEARTHLARVRRHGANYVQDTYLAGPAEQGQEHKQEEEEEERGQEEEAAALVLALAERGEALRRLQERRERLEARLERLGDELQRELNERWMRRRRRELEAAGCSLPEPERCTTELSGCWADGEGEEAAWERDRLKTQLSASLYIGLRLGADLEAVRGALEAARQDAEARRRELQHLRDALAALAVADGREEPEPKLWVPKGCEDKDEDSDTGLSSMHSQDSDCLPACESLV